MEHNCLLMLGETVREGWLVNDCYETAKPRCQHTDKRSSEPLFWERLQQYRLSFNDSISVDCPGLPCPSPAFYYINGSS